MKDLEKNHLKNFFLMYFSTYQDDVFDSIGLNIGNITTNIRSVVCVCVHMGLVCLQI